MAQISQEERQKANRAAQAAQLFEEVQLREHPRSGFGEGEKEETRNELYELLAEMFGEEEELDMAFLVMAQAYLVGRDAR